MVPIAGSAQLFPVRRIYCFFQKPSDAIPVVPPGAVAEHPYPSLTKNYLYEVELVVALGKGGRSIPVASALDHVFGHTLGLDMTRLDLQRTMGDE